MKKKIFLLFTISFAIGFLITPKVEAAVGEWIGDYCDSCGSYGSAGKCDSVTKTSVGLFRVSFYLNGKKIGTSVNVSRDASYQKLASDAKWHWGDGKTDIVSYASGTSLGNPVSGGLSSIIIPGISTTNVQNKLSPSKNSKTVQNLLNAAGITNFSFKNGKIYYKPSDVASSEDECDYQIQMVVEGMQVINWLCVDGGTDNHRWIGTPYELNNGLIAQGYNSKKGGNGYSSGSVVDKNLLSALRLDETVKIGDISFSAVTDCLTVHVRGYDANKGYGFNVYDLTGEFACEPTIPPEDDKCKYTPGEEFKTECCDDSDYLNNYYKEHGADDFIEACCEIPTYGTTYSKIFSKETFDEKYDLYCKEPDTCKPLKLTGEAYCDTTTCDDNSFSNNKSTFADPLFNSSDGKALINSLTDSNGNANLNLSAEQLKSIASDLSDDSFLAVAQQGETYKVDIGNKYCDLYCQEIAVVTLPNFSPAVNAGRFFQWYIDSDGNQPFIKQEVTRVCGEDIKLDQFMEDYYEWMYDIQDYVDTYVNANLSCDGAGPVYNYREAFDGTVSAAAKCGYDYQCAMSRLNIPPCEFQDCGNKSDRAACLEANARCVILWDDLKKTIAKIEHQLQCCSNGCTDDTGYHPPYSEELKDMRKNFQNSDHSFRESFQELLECYSSDLGTEIDTNLQFELDMSDLGNYYSEDSFTNFSTDSSKIVSSIAVCVDGQDCDDGIFSFKPEIDDYRDSGKTMTCNMDYWPSTDLLYEKYEIDCPNNTQSAVYNICKNFVEQRYYYASQSAKDNEFLKCFEEALTLVNPSSIMYPSNHQYIAPKTGLDQNGDNKVSMKEACIAERNKCVLNYGKLYSDKKHDYSECLGDKQNIDLTEKFWCRSAFYYCDSDSDKGLNFEKICSDMPDNLYTVQNNNETKCTIKPKKRRTSSLPNFLEGKNYDINSFPITVNDFSWNNRNNNTNGWSVTETASKYNPDNINWFNTFRLIAQTKVDSYELNDGINACVCSDGTVGNLISKADAPSGMTVNGDYYCDCDPEESYNDYSNATSGSSSFVEVNERWGKCQYSGYTTIEEGSNYSIKYSMASGQYPLSVYYWNIGSIDLNDGNAHFDSMIDKCCSGGICSYAGDACKLIIGNAIMTDNWSNQYTNWWDLSASYYVCKNGQCKNPEPEPVCPDGECPPDTPDTPEPTCPDGDCDEPEPNCPEGNCANPSGLAIIYRTVDLNDPFPNRNAGENWQNLEGKISENRGVDGTDLYSSNLKPLYYFKFTPDVIKNIRAFNSAYGRDYSTSSTIAYPNNLMVKKDENGKNIYDENGNVIYTKGISQVLNNELIVYFARAAANNGDDLDEWFDVPLIQNCDDYYKAYSNDEDGNSYCVDIQDSFVVVQGDSECWQNVGVNPAYMGGEK